MEYLVCDHLPCDCDGGLWNTSNKRDNVYVQSRIAVRMAQNGDKTLTVRAEHTATPAGLTIVVTQGDICIDSSDGKNIHQHYDDRICCLLPHAYMHTLLRTEISHTSIHTPMTFLLLLCKKKMQIHMHHASEHFLFST
jgi:hypothetical protein